MLNMLCLLQPFHHVPGHQNLKYPRSVGEVWFGCSTVVENLMDYDVATEQQTYPANMLLGNQTDEYTDLSFFEDDAETNDRVQFPDHEMFKRSRTYDMTDTGTTNLGILNKAFVVLCLMITNMFY